MAYGDFKDLTRTTASNKKLGDKTLQTLPKIKNMIDSKEVLLQRFINFLTKRLLLAVVKSEDILNKESAKELHKPIFRKFNQRKVPFYRQYLGCRCSRSAINKQI